VDFSSCIGFHAFLWTVNLILLTKSFLFFAAFTKPLGNLGDLQAAVQACQL